MIIYFQFYPLFASSSSTICRLMNYLFYLLFSKLKYLNETPVLLSFIHSNMVSNIFINLAGLVSETCVNVQAKNATVHRWQPTLESVRDLGFCHIRTGEPLRVALRIAPNITEPVFEKIFNSSHSKLVSGTCLFTYLRKYLVKIKSILLNCENREFLLSKNMFPKRNRSSKLIIVLNLK